MSAQDAVEALDSIAGLDPEVAHITADAILLATVRDDVAAAYARLQERCEWWASS